MAATPGYAAAEYREISVMDGRALRLYRGSTSVWLLVQTPRAAWIRCEPIEAG